MATEAEKPDTNATEEEKLLEEIRERFTYAFDQWREIQEQGDIDMRYVAGDPWDPEDRKAREDAGRPCLALDELGQYYNQVINDIRANPIAMKYDPTGGGASEKGAEFYADKAREIEYRSHAQIGYTTAFQNCVQRSFGWVRLKTDFAHERTEEQEIWIEDVPDPNGVIPDPNAKRPDFSDGKYLFYVEGYDPKEFKRRWPDAKIQDFSGEIANLAPQWIKGERILVGEYWKIKTRERKLALYQPSPTMQQGPTGPAPVPGKPVKLFEDEADKKAPGATKVQDLRVVDYPTVCQYLTNGVEILETNEWAGKYIPFASCFGNVIYVKEGGQTKRKIFSMTRLARGAHMLYCYYRTAQAEVVGRSTKNSAIGYKGQFRGVEEDWQKSVHEPMAFLQADHTIEGLPPGTILPLPRMNSWEPPIQALEMGAEGARRAIQAAMMGSPLPTDAQRHNQKSGVALEKIDSNSQKGSFHFVDHYKDMIRHVGVMIEDLMGKIHDTAREIGVRKANETAKVVKVNDPTDPESVSTQGDYLVTVSTGPSFESEREAASDFADTLAQNPQIFPLIGPLVVKLKNLGPIGDEIAKALEVLQPPELRVQKDGQPDPVAQGQQALQENVKLKGLLEQAQKAIDTDRAKQEGQIEVKKLDVASREKIALATLDAKRADNETKLAVAELGAKVDRLALFLEERARLGVQQHEAEQAGLGRQHDVGMAAMTAEQQAQASAQGHAQTLEQGGVSHGQALEAGEIEAQRAAEQAAAEQAAEQGAV